MKTGAARVAVLIGGMLASVAGAAGVQDKPKGKTEPRGVPLELVLKSKEATYKIDLEGKTPAEYRKEVEGAIASARYPVAPRVDLELEVRNTGKEEVQFRMGGTLNVILLELKGPGAVSTPIRAITPKFLIASSTVRIAPGKSKTVAAMHNLSFGLRGTAFRAYWTEPGIYTLTASYKTTVSPAPKDAAKGPDGFCPVTLTSAPITIKVEKK